MSMLEITDRVKEGEEDSRGRGNFFQERGRGGSEAGDRTRVFCKVRVKMHVEGTLAQEETFNQ